MRMKGVRVRPRVPLSGPGTPWQSLAVASALQQEPARGVGSKLNGGRTDGGNTCRAAASRTRLGMDTHRSPHPRHRSHLVLLESSWNDRHRVPNDHDWRGSGALDVTLMNSRRR